MEPEAYIFIGRSGAGKGTQVALLKEKLKLNRPESMIYSVETGARFREFIKEDSHSSNLSKAVMATGDRQPAFLAVWLWAHLLVQDLKGGETLIFDGTPRSVDEARALDSALAFYGYPAGKRHVVYLAISTDEARDRLTDRGRADDSTTNIDKRLDWFADSVVPAIEYYRTNPNYNFVEINGEKTVEEIHQVISQAVEL